MSNTEVFEEDEISLFDLWQTLMGGWRYVVGGILVGGLGAVAVFSISASVAGPG